jgi:hypothetical protein
VRKKPMSKNGRQIARYAAKLFELWKKAVATPLVVPSPPAEPGR